MKHDDNFHKCIYEKIRSLERGQQRFFVMLAKNETDIGWLKGLGLGILSIILSICLIQIF